MTERTKTGLEIVLAAAVMGIFGNLMLRQTPWGLNAFLFVTAFAVGLFVLTRMRRPELLTVNRIALLGAMVFFGSMFVLRDAIELRVYDTFAILILMGVLLLGTLGINARVAGVFHYACGFVWSGLVSLLAPFVLLGSDIDWKAMPGTKISRQVSAVLRGAAVAIPLLLIFGALFSSADARFEAFANRFINFDLETVISHVLITSGLAWLSAGYYRASIFTPGFASAESKTAAESVPTAAEQCTDANGSYFEKAAAEPATDENSLPDNATILEHINRSDPPNAPADAVKAAAKKRDWQHIDSSSLPSVFTLGTIETVIILGLIDVLFLSFVVIQVPYLFGGMDLVQNTPDFKLADYARRGFGELVAVSALVLPMLLLSHWLLRRETKRVENIFRILAGIQIALVFVIMASAVQRLVLLTGEAGYGMTTVRFYPMVFMIWLAVVFGWFALTVFRGARNNFAWGALWSAIAILGATNLMNPNAFIARTNVELMHQGREFDANYIAELGSDAVEPTLAAIPTMNAENQCRAKFELHMIYWEIGKYGDIRSLNLSRRAAFQLLRQNDALLHEREGCPDWMKLPD
ncbi:MAG: DUF4173 domain-containing protein [Acidobacteriota bacterium]